MTKQDIIDTLGIEEDISEEMKNSYIRQYRFLAKKFKKQENITIWLQGDFGAYIEGAIIYRTKDLYAIKEFTKEMALEVAKTDYYEGIEFAMEQLNNYGIPTPVYNKSWEMQALLSEPSGCDDDLNLLARDLQYSELGILGIMTQAYQEVWNK